MIRAKIITEAYLSLSVIFRLLYRIRWILCISVLFNYVISRIRTFLTKVFRTRSITAEILIRCFELKDRGASPPNGI